jgi:hypothetical protein
MRVDITTTRKKYRVIYADLHGSSAARKQLEKRGGGG